ncbi:phospholipase D/nuclease [Stipitochalara longipes BDJ]|nr:phospholipase D/nuclease [Stipitochalara longipes BDJ]
MDDDIERALAASRSEHAHQLEEDRQLQEAIQLSLMEDSAKSSTTFEDQLRERSARMKRKAEEELRPGSVKRIPSASLPMSLSSSKSTDLKSLVRETGGETGPGCTDSSKRTTARLSNLESIPDASAPKRRSAATKEISPPPLRRKTANGSSASSSASSSVKIKYPNGALRITRTPGRRTTKNCINLKDVIHKDHLISACVFSFFIGDMELYDHLPLSHSSSAVPIYIGRDANMDPMVQGACHQAGISFNGEKKLSNKQLQSIVSNLRRVYSEQYGKNYHAFYAWSPGSSHSKILVLVYPDFLRLVITSCNMMDIDTILGDNHWYIHDLPKLPSRATSGPSSFETGFLAHMQALGTPDDFLDTIRGMYDFSTVKVHLITSVPGVCSGIKAEKHGLLRLRRVVHDLDLSLSDKDSGDLGLEICAASIGKLNAKWLNGFYDCALGKETIEVAGDNCTVPDLKLFYPSVGDVKKAHESAQEAASNIGCHTRPWDDAPAGIKHLFHHYESKDTGRLFHQKLILAFNPHDTNAPPYYVYVGSANLSQSAWGAIEQDKKANEATCNMKLVKLSNFECGVVIPGHLIKGLLEPGTESWQSGIVPYVQTGKRYDLPKDRPWNDPRWVQNYQEDYRGT